MPKGFANQYGSSYRRHVDLFDALSHNSMRRIVHAPILERESAFTFA